MKSKSDVFNVFLKWKNRLKHKLRRKSSTSEQIMVGSFEMINF